MPGANEDLGCPRKYIFFIRPAKFMTTFFSHSPNFFTFSHPLSHFTKIGSLDAPLSAASCPVTTFFSSFLAFTYICFTKTGPLDAPQGGCPGPSHRPHPPLHATAVHICLVCGCYIIS